VDPVVDAHAILDATPAADPHARVDVGVLADRDPGLEMRTAAHVREVPDVDVVLENRSGLDDGRRVDRGIHEIPPITMRGRRKTDRRASCAPPARPFAPNARRSRSAPAQPAPNA